jgi:hypothetical protein
VLDDPNATAAAVTGAQTALIAVIAQARLRAAGGPVPAGLAGLAGAAPLLPASSAAKAALEPAAVAEAEAGARGVALRTLKTAKPKLAGKVQAGHKVRARAGTWTPGAALAYQWYRGGKPIAKAVKSTYKVKRSDAGKKISVKVTGAKAGFKTVTRASAKKRAAD